MENISRLMVKSIQFNLFVGWMRHESLKRGFYYERNWRDNVTVDWQYKCSSGDAKTASTQPVGLVGAAAGEIEALTVQAQDPPYRVQSRDDLL